MQQRECEASQSSNTDYPWSAPVSDTQCSKRLKVLIWGAGGRQDHFTQILAANIQQWGYEATLLSSGIVLSRVERDGGEMSRGAVEGDILVYDLDDDLRMSTLIAGKPGNSVSLAALALAGSDGGGLRVRLIIALSTRSVSRLTLEQIGAVALLYKPFEMERLQRYLRVFQQVLGAGSGRVNGHESDELLLEAVSKTYVGEDVYEGYGRRSARILVVDDHAQVAETIQQCLECEPGYEVRIASDGLDALEQCVAWRPHCIVTDLLMPYMNGYQVMRSLAAAQCMPTFVVISALTQHELPEQHAYPPGKAVVFIDKPFQVENLLDAVERALAQ